MNTLIKIAKYFKNWDGEDEDVTDIRLSTQDLRFIIGLNVERGAAESKLESYKKFVKCCVGSENIKEWISTQDKLPPVDVEVLGFCFGTSYLLVKRDSYYNGGWTFEEGELDDDDVTHWIPLPPLPQD